MSVAAHAAVIPDIQSEKTVPGNISQAAKEIPGRRRKGCGIKIEKRNGSRKQRLCKELQHYQKAGVRLLLNGRPSSPEEIARVCTFREDRCYMRDYISNDSNELWGIGFDFVRDMK